MNAAQSPARRTRRLIAGVALGSTLLASFAGAMAFRSISARPGEAALRLVPADAILVGTVDISPSASQVIAFKHIDDALARNGMDSLLQTSILDMFEPTAKGRESLRPLILRHGAFALLPAEGRTGDGRTTAPKAGEPPMSPVALIAVTSGADALKVLQSEGEARYFKGFKHFKLRNGSKLYAVIDDVLIVSDDPANLAAISKVRGGAANILSNANFMTSRANIADDANLMFFVSPKLIDSAPGAPQGLMADWMTMGVAIRDGGIGISYAGSMDPSKEPALKRFGQIVPVRNDIFRILPTGAYGVVALSQPTEMFNAAEPSITKDAHAKKAYTDMQEGMRKETGMDFQKDVLPAFKGNTILAAYPTVTPAAGIDLLVVVDDLNGADPANAADRLASWVQEQMEKEGGEHEAFVKSEKDGVTYHAFAEKTASELRESMREGMTGVKKGPIVDNKTITWAVVGKGVIVASSKTLLDRAVAAYRSGQDSLVGDANYLASQSEVLDGSQSLGLFSLSRIAEGIKNTMDDPKMSKEDRQNWNRGLGAFQGLNEPFRFRARMMPSGQFAGGTFIPMDYDKMLDFAGDAMKQSKR